MTLGKGSEETLADNHGPTALRASGTDEEMKDPAGQPGAAAPTPRPSPLRRAISRVVGIQELAPGIALIVVVLLIGLTHSRFFASQTIAANVRVASYVGIVAFGMVFLLAMGEIDLSVGGIYGLCFFVCAKLADNGAMNLYVAALIAIAAGVGLGLVNGLLVWMFRAPGIIVTLGTFSLYGGLVAVISNGESVGGQLPREASFFTTVGGDWLGIPVSGWVALVLMVLLTVLLNKSRPGAMIRAIGSNPSAAMFAGIPDRVLRTFCLMLTGGLAGISGVLTLAYSRGGDSSIGSGLELQVIAAAIIGGTAITGGSGSVPGGLIGALLIAAINSGLVFFNVNPLWNDVVTGVVILIAVGSAALLSHHRRGRVVRLDV
jgi:ribose transport system permease protein